MIRWKEEEKNAIRSLDELKRHIRYSPKELKQLEKVCHSFCMKITPYYLGLLDKENPDDPLRQMAIPSIRELHVKKGEMDDPIGDTNPDLENQPEVAITHRYLDRVLLYPTPECGGYCRHCFRRRLAGKQEFQLTREQMDTALDYIAKNKMIHEVILTGGDPLMLSDRRLKDILTFLRRLKHIRTIRIHSRMPVWNPYRITDSLVEILKKVQPLWIVTHFNHPRELSDVAVSHLAKLIDRGIMVLNQAVLLKGVNDTPELQRELGWALIQARVKPYYLHHLDKAKGISHFRVAIKKGMRILRELRGTLPGYAIPHYILDIPGGYGKIPLQYHYLSHDGRGTIVAETPDGTLRAYIDGEGEVRHSKDFTVDTLKPVEHYPEQIIRKIQKRSEEKT
jgi:lysine 2,3-aminomutase